MYHTFSPNYVWSDNISQVIHVSNVGHVGSYNVDNVGGVQFIELCYEYIFAEAGLRVMILV